MSPRRRRRRWIAAFTSIALATAGRKQLEPGGATWQAVLQTTGQPSCFTARCD